MVSSGLLRAAEKACLGLNFTCNTNREIAAVITTHDVIAGEGPRTILTANLDHIVTMDKRPDFRSAYEKAWLVTADGMPVYVYGILRGAGLAHVTGSDLFAQVMPLLRPREHRCFFIVPTVQVGTELVAILKDRGFRASEIGFACPQFGFETDEQRSDDLIAAMRALRPTHIFFGLGAPKSELWAERYRARLGDSYVLHVGAGLEFFAGTRVRAPRPLQILGLEWFWRWLLEPQRLFRRYFVDSWRFLAIVQRDLIKA